MQNIYSSDKVSLEAGGETMCRMACCWFRWQQ